MKIIDALQALRAMEVLGELASGDLTRAVLDKWGFRDAKLWEKLAAKYYGPTRYRKLQAAAREAAAPLSMDAVVVIEKHLRNLLKGADVTVEELRVELCSLRGSVAEIDRAAAARVLEHNRTVKDAANKAHGRRALRGGKNTDALGMRTLTLTLPERQIAHIVATLQPTADSYRAADPRLGWEPAMADAAYAHLTSGVPGSRPADIPHVVISLPDYAKVLRHEGDETIFALTDGTTITGKQLVEQEMATHGLVGIYDPVEGGVNLYRDQRHANWKQRMLAAAETILCPFPECTTAASMCQVHHLQAWKQGGETNLLNLSIACPVHNARNDDDPNAPPRNGRLEREPGGVVHYPPDGGPPRRNTHPIRELSAMALIS
ncbi:MAG: HNH endonuclease signature motif containing protein [Corynebacterium sp.]|uniref:HNH endonuclease signature motif containing protein n=1 Tax=Corynebacterium sp. TaxID=1720 RepID=UPI0026E0AE32|nr:HNH endonuclease signature motif containing protein [Corynebacterium sp.]MDO5669036.1 HNH endonuclease signature motif containing protein [Corynebacterium sp.]